MNNKHINFMRQIIHTLAIDNLTPDQLPGFRLPKKCILPGCDNMTTHRGGYCCREHCLEHRELFKNRSKKRAGKREEKP